MNKLRNDKEGGADPLYFGFYGVLANSVRFLTGHSRKGGADPLFVAENAADPDSTLVVYMGLSTLPSLVSKLIQHGLPPDTPAAAVK